MNKSILIVGIIVQLIVTQNPIPYFDKDEPENVTVNDQDRHESRDTSGESSVSSNEDVSVSSCWSEVPGRKKGSHGWWMGVCEDALDYCGGTAVMVAKEHAEEKMAPSIDFSRQGGGYAATKARCTVFKDEEEDLDSAVAEVFERLPLPVPVVVSEPEVLSLVNLENYVRGVVDDFDTTVELLDQQVRITAYPTVWSWDMGDGTTYERTAEAGGFPDGGVLHPFYRVGEYDMRVTVTWEGHYQPVGSDAWLPVNGQGHTTSEPEHLAIEERRAYLGTPPDEPDE